MGYSSWDSTKWDMYHKSAVAGKAVDRVYVSSNMPKEFDPKGVVRESRDSEDHPNSTPIIIGLDVTGSMGRLLQVIADKLGVLVNEIIGRKPIPDPQIMFNAIGDAIAHDEAPLQVTQFESDILIAEQLTKLWFERGGGGNHFESYPLAWYFAARKTAIDSVEKHGRKGILFTIGDDGLPEKLTAEEINRVFGDDIGEDIDVEALLSEVSRKYEVFHLHMREGHTFRESDLEKWQSMLGENAIRVSDTSKIPEIIVSILQRINGASVEEIVKSWDGSTAVVVREALGGISAVNKGGALVTF